MGGNADPAWGFAPMAEGADWCGFFLAAPVRRFTELRYPGVADGCGWMVSVALLRRCGFATRWMTWIVGRGILSVHGELLFFDYSYESASRMMSAMRSVRGSRASGWKS